MTTDSAKALAAVYYTMPDSPDLVHVFHNTVFGIDQNFQNQFHTCSVVRKILLIKTASLPRVYVPEYFPVCLHGST